MKHRLLGACALLLALAGAPADAAIRAWLDSTQVSSGQTVQLTLSHDGPTFARPDLTPLQQDFDILGTSSSTNIQIINGRASSGTQLILSLAPKRSGQLTIPAISWGTEQSQPLTLTVSASGSGGSPGAQSGPASKVFIKSEFEPQQPFVLAAVRVAVHVYAAEPLYHPSLDLPTTNDAIVRQIGRDQVSSAVEYGESYQVVTRRYLIFPQRSGKLSIPGATLDADVMARSLQADPNNPFSGFFGGMLTPTRHIRLSSDPIALQVQARPADASSAAYWLPARSVSLAASWHPGQLQARVGDPISLDLQLRAEGLTAAQLPDLTSLLSVPGALKTYPEQPKLRDVDDGDTVQGSREQTIALIADQPGHYNIPALHVSWWDTISNQAREATLPERTLVILPAAGATPPVAAAQATNPAAVAGSQPAPAHPQAAAIRREPGGGAPWRWISVGLIVLWLATLGAWLLSRRPRKTASPQLTQRQPSGTGSQARGAFLDACRHNDAPGARRNLLAWAGERWGAAPSGLNALATRLDNPTLTPLLRELDRACFAGGSWHGEPLASLLTELPAPEPTRSKGSSGLAPLYR